MKLFGPFTCLTVIFEHSLHARPSSVCLSACLSTRFKGIGTHRVSLAAESWWLMAWRWFIRHVRRAGSREKALLSLSFGEAGCCFSFCSLRLPPLCAPLPSLLLSPCSALLDLAVKLICGRKRSTSGRRSIESDERSRSRWCSRPLLQRSCLTLSGGLMTC